jgi:hypothetical protein
MKIRKVKLIGSPTDIDEKDLELVAWLFSTDILVQLNATIRHGWVSANAHRHILSPSQSLHLL